jgi:hypothetical protein
VLAREGMRDGCWPVRAVPIDEVRDKLERRPNYFGAIDEAPKRFTPRLHPATSWPRR